MQGCRLLLSKAKFARIRRPLVALAFLFLVDLPLLPAKAYPPTAQTQTCEPHQLASLDLEIPDNGQVLVPVTVNNARFYMYFEIASPFTEVSEQAVVRFALPRTDIGKDLDITSGGKRVQQYATMSFQLGDATYSEEHILIDPQSAAPRRYTRTDIIGFLGIDSFGKWTWT